MLDFRRRSIRGLTLSSILSFSALLGAACGPGGELEDSREVGVPTHPDDSAEASAPVGSEDASEPSAPVGSEDASEPSAPTSLVESTAGLGSTTIPPAPAGLRTVADWETLFLKRWNTDHTGDFLPRSTSRDSWQFYNLGYGIDGNTAMFRATGKTQYLDRALLYVNNMVNSAQVSSSLNGSKYKDSYLGWLSKRSETLNQEIPLYESYCWRYVTRLLRVIRETPELYNNSTYRAQYDKLLAFTEKNIFEKWYKRGANANIYRVNTHMSAHWAFIAMDLSRMTTDAARKATYLEVFNNINRNMPNYPSSLREQMGPSPVNAAAYFWSDTWGSHSRPGQDVSHGNGLMAFIVEAHEAGMEWTDKDMRAFTATLNSVIWPAAGKYGNYVDGSGKGNGWFNDGLMKLGRYSTSLQKRLETHSVGNNTQFYGNGALNVRMLSEGYAL